MLLICLVFGILNTKYFRNYIPARFVSFVVINSTMSNTKSESRYFRMRPMGAVQCSLVGPVVYNVCDTSYK